MKKFTKNLLLLATAMLLSIGVYAQGRGNLSGYVKDESGSILPGAAVFLKGTTLGTSTDMNGAYTLQGVPAGDAEISVTYLGYNTKTVKIKVKAGATESFNIVMSQLAKSIEGVTVTAMIDGQQRALNQQMQADNLMSVISADQIGLFPDLNVSDALKRMSGITSDGKTVSLRGTPSSFTNINIDGNQLIGTEEGGIRAPSLEAIPSDVLASMEIQKTLLPSSDGDAIGGVINLRSGGARSLTPKFSVDLGTGINFLRDKAAFNGKLSYAQRFHRTDKNPNGTFGVSAKYSYNNNYGGYDRIEAQDWVESELVGGDEGKNYWVPSDFRYRYQESHSVRQGATLVLDWAPNLNTKFVLTSGYNKRSDDSERYRNRFRMRKSSSYWKMDSFNDADNALNPDDYENIPTEGFGPNAIGGDRLQNVIQYTNQTSDISNYNVALNGESVIGNWKVDGTVAYTAAQTIYTSFMPSFQTPEYRANAKDLAGTGNPAMKFAQKTLIGYIPDVSSPYLSMDYLRRPNGATAGEAMDAMSRYYLNVIDNWNNNTYGDNLTAQLNSSYSHFVGKNASTLSFGVKGKFTGNNGYVPKGTNVYDYSFPKGAIPDQALSLSNLLLTKELDPHFLNNNLVLGLAPDGDKIRAGMANNNFDGKMILSDYKTNSTMDAYYFDANEKVYAAYAMEKIQFNKLMLLFGARVEHNRVTYKANEVFRYNGAVDLTQNPSGQTPGAIAGKEDKVYDAYKATPKDSTITYTQFLPNIQFKYELGKSSVLRLAYTTGYSRPNVIDLLPKTDIDQDNGVITVGNPDLKPAYAHNLDLLLEHYLGNVGILSGGFFFKNIDNFQYLGVTPIGSDNPYHGAGYEMMWKQQNGDKATIMGVELNVNSTLTFLPGFLKNLVFTGNYTYVNSKATVQRKISDEATVSDKIRLPGQADHTANIALAYSAKRFTVQAAFNYIGSYIMSLGADASRDVWLDGRWQMDVNGSVSLYKGLSFWVEAQNVLNKEAFQYYGDKSRVYSLQYNGAVARCGFTYKF